MRNIFLVLLIFNLCDPCSATDFPGAESNWKGFKRFDFKVDGRNCIVVIPKVADDEKPWVWRARFFGHQPQADIALLNEGFHLAYCDVGGLYGNDAAVKHWNAFYRKLTSEHGLNKRPALEGMSRGGLIIYNWASQNPDKVSCIYGDAPVCDFKSWPGGKGSGKGSPPSWKQCLAAYKMTEAEALKFEGNPIDNLQPLAKAKIPILHVVGAADDVVPVAENSAIIEQRYLKLGGSFKVISKAGVGHHPHALEDPAPIVTFIRKHAQPNIRKRGNLQNCRKVFEKTNKGHVAFLGGSITEMNGYRPMVCDELKKRFPKTEFSFINAGIASTCSNTGAFRLHSDVLSKGKIDLLFVEFAVNDDQDAAHSAQNCIRGMEGIIRQVRRHNPHADIVMTHFVNPGMMQLYQQGKTPLSIQSHEAVAAHYGVSTIQLAKEIAEQVSDEKITWKQFGGTHPQPFGNRICAKMISKLFDRCWASKTDSMLSHELPKSLLDSGSFADGKFISIKEAVLKNGWTVGVPDWKNIPGGKRGRFTEIPILSAGEIGSELSLDFTGQTVGAYLLAGPNAGAVEVQIDGGEFESIETFHRYSKGLHYPRTVLFATDLKDGPHKLLLRVQSSKKSGGSNVRIMQFVVN